MQEAIIAALPQFGVSIVFLAISVKLFQFLMDRNTAFTTYLIQRNSYLEEQNKLLIQALYNSGDADKMRLASALISRAAPTDIKP